MSKIIVSDYDKTLYLSDQGIVKNKLLIDKFMAAGNLFVVATGRGFVDFCEVANTYEFKYNYVLLNHGGTIIDKQNQVLLNTFIPEDTVLELEKDLDLPNCDHYYCCSILENVDFNHKSMTKIGVCYKSNDYAYNKLAFLKRKYSNDLNIYYVWDGTIEIVSKEVNKAKAIFSLIHMLDLDEDNVWVIGDDYNDLEMIKRFKGCCMKESIDELKRYAIKEYPSVSDMIKDVLNDKI